MHLLIFVAEEAKNPILPDAPELVYGTIAFVLVFLVIAKFALPGLNKALEERRSKIQGDLEGAEKTRQEADAQLADYKAQLVGAREESNRIIEEARKTADQLRRDIQAKAEQEAQATVNRAQEEIRAERDRVFSELKAQVGDIAVELAGRVVGQSLDRDAHEKLIDDYIEQVAHSGRNGDG